MGGSWSPCPTPRERSVVGEKRGGMSPTTPRRRPEGSRGCHRDLVQGWVMGGGVAQGATGKGHVPLSPHGHGSWAQRQCALHRDPTRRGLCEVCFGQDELFHPRERLKDTGESNSLYPKPSSHLQRVENSTISISGTAEMVTPETPEHSGDLKPENQPKTQQ